MTVNSSGDGSRSTRRGDAARAADARWLQELPARARAASLPPIRLQFWRGASGRRYVHAVYSLIACPPLPRATYALVHRSETGSRTILAVGRLTRQAPSANLAQIRRRGALLGADEVHVHLLARSEHERRLVEMDLAARTAIGDGTARD